MVKAKHHKPHQLEKLLSPMLEKPRPRSQEQAFPSAVHLGVSATVATAGFAIAFAMVFEMMDPKDPARQNLLLGLQVRDGLQTLRARGGRKH
jgi:hypothetical protein